MPHKEKYPLECKLAICNAILHGTLTISGAARQYHIGYATIRDWLLTYQSDGTGGLVPGRHCKSYSPDLKWSAVQDYLSGKGTATQIGTKYRIKSIDRLRVWIKRYNSHDEFKLRSGGSTVMTKTRKTTEEERLEIVEYCVAHDNNYGEAALKYRVSYQQVYQWLENTARWEGLACKTVAASALVQCRAAHRKKRCATAWLNSSTRTGCSGLSVMS